MLLRGTFKTRLQLVAVTLAGFYLLNASLQSIFFGADREIIYNHTTQVFLCLKNSTICAYSSELKLANTGVEILNDITVNLSKIPKSLLTSHRVRNLNAGKPRDIDPNVENLNLKEGNRIKISNLSPGALIVVEFSGSIPIARKSLLTNLDISVVSEATIINADPQGTEFSRLWSKFL